MEGIRNVVFSIPAMPGPEFIKKAEPYKVLPNGEE
jgi:hypothetical protein